jgi:hypothetical protein
MAKIPAFRVYSERLDESGKLELHGTRYVWNSPTNDPETEGAIQLWDRARNDLYHSAVHARVYIKEDIVEIPFTA